MLSDRNSDTWIFLCFFGRGWVGSWRTPKTIHDLGSVWIARCVHPLPSQNVNVPWWSIAYHPCHHVIRAIFRSGSIFDPSVSSDVSSWSKSEGWVLNDLITSTSLEISKIWFFRVRKDLFIFPIIGPSPSEPSESSSFNAGTAVTDSFRCRDVWLKRNWFSELSNREKLLFVGDCAESSFRSDACIVTTLSDRLALVTRDPESVGVLLLEASGKEFDLTRPFKEETKVIQQAI